MNVVSRWTRRGFCWIRWICDVCVAAELAFVMKEKKTTEKNKKENPNKNQDENENQFQQR